MHRARRLGLVGWLALAVAVMLAGCSQTPLQQGGGPLLGVLSRAQFSSPTLSLSAITNPGYTTLVPSASAIAKGLGNDEWEATLSTTGDFVVQCNNHGTQTPQGSPVNYPILSLLAAQELAPTDPLNKNGTEPVALNSESFAYYQDWVASNVSPAVVCPNANYTVELLGFLWPSITINLYGVTYDSAGNKILTLADSVTFVCSDPANPSPDTCPIQKS